MLDENANSANKNDGCFVRFFKFIIAKCEARKQVGKLKSLDSKKIPKFTFAGKKMYAKVTKIYDGDTVWIAFIFKNEYVKISFRLNGIDTPEMKSKNHREKIMAQKAKERLTDLIGPTRIVYVHVQDEDKYGRLLGKLWQVSGTKIYNLKSCNQQLLDDGLALPYDGGTKTKWNFDNKTNAPNF